VLLALALSTVTACLRDRPTGQTALPVYQGEEEPGAPWVVAVHYQRPGTTKIRLCTGSVIAPRVVVTAKHCVHDETTEDVWTPVGPEALTVSVGTSMIDSGGIVNAIGVVEIITTPGIYQRQDALNGDDLALLRLAADAGAEPVQVSMLPPSPEDQVFIAGFGWTEDDVLGVKHSGQATVNVVDPGTFETNGPAWTCTGDSGGPALHVGRHELLGVTSIGPKGCSTPRSIYTRLDRHAALLAQALGSTLEEERGHEAVELTLPAEAVGEVAEAPGSDAVWPDATGAPDVLTEAGTDSLGGGAEAIGQEDPHGGDGQTLDEPTGSGGGCSTEAHGRARTCWPLLLLLSLRRRRFPRPTPA
jgi:V8-like Glu-specific endopeptidase